MAVHSQLQQQRLQMAAALAAAGTACGGSNNQAPTLVQKLAVPASVFSEPESELTCNMSRSGKRARDEPQPPMAPLPASSRNVYQQQTQIQQQFLLRKQQLLLFNHAAAAALQDDTSRLIQSTMASTSGRLPLVATAATPAEPSPVFPGHHYSDTNSSGPVGSSSSSLISMLHSHSLEVDALVRLHAENLRSGVDDVRKRQCRAIAAALEQHVQRRVAEKQAELEAAAKRNADLQERLRKATAESEAWFDIAKNSEALVTELQASLEQALLQKVNDGDKTDNWAAGVDLPGAAAKEEGYGDSAEEAASAASCSPIQCGGMSSSVCGAATNKPSAVGGFFIPCKACGELEASVLLLPCRHLCLCPSCESFVDGCPVCHSRKSATLQINLR